MKAVTEEELLAAEEAFAGLAERAPVRKAIDVIIRNLQLELMDAIGDENNPESKAVQLGAQLAGTQLLEGAFLKAEARELVEKEVRDDE